MKPECGELSITTRLKRDGDLIFAVVCAAAFAVLLVVHPQKIVYDQQFILDPLAGAFALRFDDGPVTRYLVSLFELLFHGAAPKTLNTVVSLCAMLLYSGAAFALARRELKTVTARCLFVAFLFASRFPVLWLSTEPIVGAFVTLSVLAIASGWSAVAVASLLALTAFTKPDLLLLSVCVLAYYVYTRKTARDRKQAILVFLGVAVLLNAPGLLVKGPRYFGGRAFDSIAQHYAALVAPHQLAAHAPEPWLNSHQYMKAGFPEAHSVSDLIVKYPSKYFDYVTLSAARGLKNVARALGLLLLLIPLRLLLGFRGTVPARSSEKIFAVSLIGFLPMIAFSYPHVRYLARFYPLFLVSMLVMVEHCLVSKNTRKLAVLKPIVVTVVVLALAMQTVTTAQALGALAPDAALWFPD